MCNHAQDAQGHHTRARRRVVPDDDAMESLGLLGPLERVERRLAVAAVDDLEGHLRRHQRVDLALAHGGGAAVDVADHMRVRFQHDLGADGIRSGDRWPAGMDGDCHAVLLRPAHHGGGVLARLHRPETDLAHELHAVSRHLGEVLLDHAELEDGRAAVDLHPRRAQIGVSLGRDHGERFEARDVLGPARQVYLARGNHGGEAAVEPRLDEVHGPLARGEVAEDGMAVRVDEAGNDRAAPSVDHRVGVDVEAAPHGGDGAVGHHDAVAVQQRARDVAGDDGADVFDEYLHLESLLLFLLSLTLSPPPCPLPLGRGNLSDGEVGAAGGVILEEARHGPLPTNLALLDDVRAIRQPRRELEILLREQNGQALPLQRGDLLAEGLYDHGRQPLGRLVEEENTRIAHERARHREHLLLASGEAAPTPARQLAQLGKVLVDALDAPATVTLGAHREVLSYCEIAEDAPVLGHPAYAEPADLVWKEGLERPVIERDGAARHRDHAHDGLEGGGLPRAVAPEQR